MASQKTWDSDLQMFVEPGTVDRKRLAHLRHLALNGALADDGAKIQETVASPRANGLRVRVCADKTKKCGICEECAPEQAPKKK